MDWKEAEEYVRKQFEKEGFIVINQNEVALS